jgi:hypothetical protein
VRAGPASQEKQVLPEMIGELFDFERRPHAGTVQNYSGGLKSLSPTALELEEFNSDLMLHRR